MARSGKSGAASSNRETILGTVMRLCGPLGVLTVSWKKPCKAKLTVVSCSELEISLTLGAMGFELPQSTHSCENILIVNRLTIKNIRTFFIFYGICHKNTENP